jgi:thioredoxin reductase (NADPH)
MTETTMQLTVYGADWCPDCRRSKAFLDEHAVPYTYVDVDHVPGAREIVQRYNGGRSTIPTIVFPDGTTLSEPSNDELAAKLGIGQDATHETETVRSLIIIGSGPAGYTAALYAARASLEPLVFAGYRHGGQLTLTTEVENYPGFAGGIMGPQLMAEMRTQAERFGAEIHDIDVTSVDLSHRPFSVTAEGTTYRAATVIIATGASALWLNVPGEEEYRGFGVSSCATCDGFFFRERTIAVVGGGDTALEEAIFLSRFGTKVIVIHRRDSLRASKAMQQRAFANPKISFVWNTAIDEVLGEADADTGARRVVGLRTHDTLTGEEKLIPTDALFVAIGHRPNTELFAGQLPLDEQGYLLAADTEGTATAVDGVFVAGDVRDHRYRQAVTAAGEGAKAAIDAERWLEERGIEHGVAKAMATV